MNYLEETEMRMLEAIENLEKRLVTIRAGRANPSMLSGVKVEYYGVPTPLNQVANITVPEARQLMVKPFDKTIIKDIEHAINEANLGIAPSNNGEVIIMTIPQMTEDTRKAYVKQASSMGEDAKVQLRNIRQDILNSIKKDDSLTEDQEKGLQEDVQELINKFNKKVEETVKLKNDELMSV
ncbi:MAG: ribosome recycling factor [Bacilli bacterium]|nr:ribosome recycling factor [Bacilli bacterium]